MLGFLVLLFPFVLLGFVLFMERVEEPLNQVAVEREIEQFLDDANPDELDTFVREGTDSALAPVPPATGPAPAAAAIGDVSAAARSSRSRLRSLDSAATCDPARTAQVRRARGADVDEVLRRAGLFQGVDPEDVEALAERVRDLRRPARHHRCSTRASPATACTSCWPAR